MRTYLPDEVWFSPGGSSYRRSDGSVISTAATSPLVPDSVEVASSSGIVPAPSTAAPAAPAPQTASIGGHGLTRARLKRKYKDGEREEFEAKIRFEERMSDVIKTGPFLKGLNSAGGGMPTDVYNRLRAKFCQEFKVKNEERFKDLPGRELGAVARKEFSKSCSWAEKRRLLQEIILEEGSKPEGAVMVKQCKAVKDCIEERYLGMTVGKTYVSKSREQINSNIILVVYNDDRFVVNDFKQTPPDLMPNDMLVVRLQEFPPYLRLKERFFQFCKDLGEKWTSEWAASIEVSPQTYEKKGQVRLHLNLALGRKTAALRFEYPYAELAFCRCLPNYHPSRDRVTELLSVKRSGFNKMWGQTAYYLQFPKILLVDSDGSKLPFKDYPVTQTAITGYLQAGLQLLPPRGFNDIYTERLCFIISYITLLFFFAVL